MSYDYLFSLDNIYYAWKEFQLGKSNKKDVMLFESNLVENLLILHHDLSGNNYFHDKYKYFQIFDPKKRDIYKAEVRDRIVHQIIFDYLSHIYEPVFIANSYASRIGKGTHLAVNKVQYFMKKTLAEKYSCWILKCDVRKYFDSIDKFILFSLIKKRVNDSKMLSVIEKIIFSFQPAKTGIPLGNITSQIFANIYLNELDQFLKYHLNANEYVRYNDDLILVDCCDKKLFNLYKMIQSWLYYELKLDLPKSKMLIRKSNQGIDFLGYVIFPQHKILRPKTRKRLKQRINKSNIVSYLGLISHCHSYKLKQEVLNIVDLNYFV